MLGALQDDDASRNKLLGAAKRLCGAFSDLLNAAEPGQKEVSKTEWQLKNWVEVFTLIKLS